MTDDLKPEPEQSAGVPGTETAPTAGAASAAARLPGMAAISLYMLFLAGTVILGVVTKNYPALYLVFPVLFIAAGGGLLMMFRWAWALTLSAVVLLAGLFLYEFSTQRSGAALVQGLLNLVFFLYLVRAEVRLRLR